MAMTSENPLRQYFDGNAGRPLINKWSHYFDIYHRHFADFRGQAPTVLEFGVFQGGSLMMWKDYFGGGRICGVDINPRCKSLEKQTGCEIFIGDQEDRGFLRELAAELGEICIVIDDGGHKGSQQIATFEEMYPAVSSPGVYLVEDLHTSYWMSYRGGCRARGTFVEYAKQFIDWQNARHFSEAPKKRQPVGRILRHWLSTVGRGRPFPAPKNFASSARCLAFYDSVLVIEKAQVAELKNEESGVKTI